MNIMKTLTRFLALVTTFALTQLHAADPKTLMTERGKLLFSEDFAKPVQAAPKAEKGKPAPAGWRERPPAMPPPAHQPGGWNRPKRAQWVPRPVGAGTAPCPPRPERPRRRRSRRGGRSS